MEFAAEVRREARDVSGSPGWKRHEPATGQLDNERDHFMLYTIAVVLLVMWLLGLVTSYTLGGFIHILLVVAIVMVLVNLISGRRAL
jgi:hypothetical protein